MTDEVLTIREVAIRLKLAGKTVYSMAQRGEIPAFKIRGQWRIQGSDLQAWIESRKQSGMGLLIEPSGTPPASDLDARQPSRRRPAGRATKKREAR